MTRVNPWAYYDVLDLVCSLAQTFDSVAPSEIHLFAYLACLLSLYRGKTATDWGYGFVATENGAPFSAAIEWAITTLFRAGFLDRRDGYLSLSGSGRREHAELGELSHNRSREEFLDGASSSLIAMPVGVIRTAVTSDHDMRLARYLGDARNLLTDFAVEDIHDAFATLSEQIGVEVPDLIVPAVVWLNYLVRAALADAE